MSMLIIAIASIITSMIFIALCYQQYKQQQRQSQHILDLQYQLTVLSSGSVSVDEKLIQLERALSKLKEQQGQLSSSIAPQHNYDHAIRLAKKGVASNQLIDNCNLSDEEAHLIKRMHGKVGALH
ncbi:MAG TPA: DUF2802 domain-containing protein [Gammaproteobacteria bacterium]|nr:DUF2802 domain-containing protein [Gammaproteobacteria bacterium]